MKFLKYFLALALFCAPAQATVEVSPITGGTITPLIDAATIVWTADRGFAYSVTLGGDRAFANPTGVLNGVIYTLKIKQDATGTRVPTWGTAYKFPGFINNQILLFALSTYPNATDILTFFSDGQNLNFIGIAQDESAAIAAPSALTASVNQVGQVTLGWTNNQTTDVTAIYIQRDNGIGFETVDTVAPTVHAYVDVITAGTYPYRVIAAHNAGPFSSPSNTANGTSLP